MCLITNIKYILGVTVTGGRVVGPGGVVGGGFVVGAAVAGVIINIHKTIFNTIYIFVKNNS